MPFTLIVDSDGAVSELRDFPDRERPTAEGLIAEFRAGVKPIDDVLTVHHKHGVFRRRWADIRDMWIEA